MIIVFHFCEFAKLFQVIQSCRKLTFQMNQVNDMSGTNPDYKDYFIERKIISKEIKTVHLNTKYPDKFQCICSLISRMLNSQTAATTKYIEDFMIHKGPTPKNVNMVLNVEVGWWLWKKLTSSKLEWWWRWDRQLLSSHHGQDSDQCFPEFLSIRCREQCASLASKGRKQERWISWGTSDSLPQSVRTTNIPVGCSRPESFRCTLQSSDCWIRMGTWGRTAVQKPECRQETLFLVPNCKQGLVFYAVESYISPNRQKM